MKKISYTLIIFFFTLVNFAQSYSIKTFNWQDAGFKGFKPIYSQTINIMSYGGNNINSANNNSALANAIIALNNKGGVIYFPKGVYSFTGQVTVNRDSITFKGDGYDSTQLRFNLNGVLNNCINITGSQVNTDTTSFSSAGVRDSNWVNVLNASGFSVGQWVYLQCTDNVYMNDSWAYKSLGDRAMQNHWADCVCSYYTPTSIKYQQHLNAANYIYPNPTQNELIFKSDFTINEVSIYDMEGKLILNKHAKHIESIDVSTLQKGIYLVCLKDKNGIKNYKLIKE